MKTYFMISLLLLPFFYAEAQVRVLKTAKDQNPTLFYQGVSGNQQLSELIASDLRNCGWFNLISGARSDYIISGSSSGSSLTFKVSHGNGIGLFSLNLPINSNNLRWTAHKAVDSVLQKMFKIPGICSTKITFSAETQPGKKEIYICDFDGHNTEKVTSNRNLSVESDWVPGGRRLIYTMYSRMFTDIVEYDLSSRRTRRLAQFPGLNAGGAISPDGRILALILSRDKCVELYIKAVNGKALQRLTNSISVEASPCWSPGGNKICYVSDLPGRPDLYVMNSRGGKSMRLQTIGSEGVSPDWSKDNKIVYSAKMGRNYTVAVIDMNGREPTYSIVNAAGDWESPSWAPDNRHVVCMRTLNGKSTLHVIDTWTGKIRQLLGGNTSLSLPSWSEIY